MEARRDSTARSRQLGDELRAKRKLAGLGSGLLASRLGWTSSKISEIESGERGTSDVDIAAYLAMCGVIGTEFERLIILCRESSKDIWVQPFGAEPSDRVPTLITEEARATRITSYDPLLIPGLLQTPDYIRAVWREGPTAQRIRRQDVLGRVTATFYIDEQVLHRPTVSPTVMHDQLMHLVLTPATVRVVPFGGFSESPFVLLENADNKPVVYLETLVANVFLENPHQIAEYRATLKVLANLALDTGQSRTFLTELADAYGRPREDAHARGHGLA